MRFLERCHAEEQAKRLIAAGYHQVSAKHRTLARLPEGKTAMQALCEADPTWIAQFERMARAQYLRVYTMNKDELSVVLDRETFEAFKKLDGPVA